MFHIYTPTRNIFLSLAITLPTIKNFYSSSEVMIFMFLYTSQIMISSRD